MTRSLALLASLLLAPSLACVSAPGRSLAGASSPTGGLAREPSVATTVFLETAGMSLTPPSSCDDIVAERALDQVHGEDASLVQPACESACRVDTCASLLVSVDMRAGVYDSDNLTSVRSELAATCEASVEGCMGVVGVVMRGEALDTIGLVAELDDAEIPSDEQIEGEAPLIDPEVDARLAAEDAARLHDACEAGDAAACFESVDVAMLYYMTEWDQARYQASMTAFERACALEPRVYCRPLQALIDDTSHDCAG